MPKKNSSGEIVFSDYPEFRPNLTPSEMFKMGSFGGTYWRPIYSSITKKKYKNKHLDYPKSWWKGIPEDWLTRDWDDYDKSINKYNVKVGTTLEFWEEKKWITKNNPYIYKDKQFRIVQDIYNYYKQTLTNLHHLCQAVYYNQELWE